MIARLCAAAAVAASFATGPLARAQNAAQVSPVPSQGVSRLPVLPERAVRRDIPMTSMIRKAFAAGTRDSTGRPGRNYWQLWTDYKISARLDSATNVISGRETVTIRNNSDSAMSSVVLRLDQNVFRPDALRISAVTDITDGMRISRLVINGQTFSVGDTLGAPIAGSTRRTTPLARALTETSARISLANPIAPHSSGILEADWSFRVPAVGARDRGYRMGRWEDTLYQVAQWYPRVAVYDDLRAGGWDNELYLGDSEFYNNFGHWDVSLDLPAGWLVAATGVLQNPNDVLTPTARERLGHVLESDSTLTIVSAGERGPGRSTAPGTRMVWRFVADTAGDFAWGTSNQYVWSATRANIPGKGFVPVNMFYLPGHSAVYSKVGPVTRHALEYYSKLWMPYAFPQLSVVDGPETGMEYPMFIMSALGAADHETGHQWWPMMVGVNETWYGFMDEGFNEYMNILSDADREGKPALLDSLGMSYARTSGDESEAPLMWNANYGGSMYSYQAYEKAPKMLSALGGVVGDTAVQRAMSEYAKAWRFKHPSPWDYAFFMNNALHRDLGWFWYYWLFTTESVDESIQSVTTNGSKTTVVVRQDGQMPAPIILSVTLAPGPGDTRVAGNMVWETINSAVATYPVDVWFAGSRTFSAVLDFGSRRITHITLDPQNRFPDHNPADNVWPRASAAPGK